MPARKIEAGPLIAIAGAVLLLVSLFLNFFAPGLTAWEVYEVIDLVLAACAIVGGLAALGLAGAPAPAIEARWLGWSAGVAFVLVAASLVNHPPAVARDAQPELGIWLALAGSALMGAGALLSTARVHVTFNVEHRRTRVAAVDARRAAAPAPAPEPGAGGSPARSDEPTRPLPPEARPEP